MRACQTLQSLTGPWGIYPACPPSALLPLSGEREANVLCVFVGGGVCLHGLYIQHQKSHSCAFQGTGNGSLEMMGYLEMAPAIRQLKQAMDPRQAGSSSAELRSPLWGGELRSKGWSEKKASLQIRSRSKVLLKERPRQREPTRGTIN